MVSHLLPHLSPSPQFWQTPTTDLGFFGKLGMETIGPLVFFDLPVVREVLDGQRRFRWPMTLVIYKYGPYGLKNHKINVKD